MTSSCAFEDICPCAMRLFLLLGDDVYSPVPMLLLINYSDLFTCIFTLQMCHKHGVMHRDLKPENFLFANKKETASLKAIDFGLSVFFKPGIALLQYCLFNDFFEIPILASLYHLYFFGYYENSVAKGCHIPQVSNLMR